MKDSENTLFLSEIFESIQGETSLAGEMTTFLRLAGCNLRCNWCDSPYTFEKGVLHTFDDVYAKIREFQWNHICITGGEPLLQKNIIPFLYSLQQRNYTISVETNGSLSIQEIPEGVIIILDIKCPGSGNDHKNMLENLKFLRPYDQIKFVIADKNDYIWAKAFLEKFQLLKKPSLLLFSPAWGLLSPQDLICWIREDKLPVRLNVQVHKYVWDQHTRGV